MATYHTEYTLEREGSDIDCFVTYTVSQYWPATYWEPASGGEIEIISIVGPDGNPLPTTVREDDEIRDFIQEHCGDELYDDAGEY